MSSKSPYRLAICRALLQVARLDHLWTGRGIRKDGRKCVHSLAETNPRDALFLRTALSLENKDFEGPRLQSIFALSGTDQSALLMAPLAARSSGQTQQWLAWVGAVYDLEPEDDAGDQQG